ncbi:MAG: hypothetical protein F6K30_27855 [Cyanothece sp. SIO2G6]|nr:hypothetical protein [Cyanothece sp. SIO2G6]
MPTAWALYLNFRTGLLGRKWRSPKLYLLDTLLSGIVRGVSPFCKHPSAKQTPYNAFIEPMVMLAQ